MVLSSRLSALRTSVPAARPGARIAVRAGRARWARQPVSRRFYASGGGHETPTKKSDLPWLFASVAVTVPSAFYLWQSGPHETEHGTKPERPLVKEDDDGGDEGGDDKQEEQPAEAPEGGEENSEEKESPPEPREESKEEKKKQKAGADEKPSEADPPHPQKGAQSVGEKSGAQSAKQQGISNSETKNPHLDDPGKSEKAEGVTDSAKVKGTVSPERPQGQQPKKTD